jgi:hypothetical protein
MKNSPAFIGVALGLVLLACAGLSVDALLATRHDGVWAAATAVALGIIAFSRTPSASRDIPAARFLGIVASAILATVIIRGDVRSWALIALVPLVVFLLDAHPRSRTTTGR